jgi:chromosome segregation ATPase
MMDAEWVRMGLSALNMLASVAMYIYMRADRQQRATVKSIDELKASVNKRFDDKCNRLNRLEGEVKGLPTRAQYDKERELWSHEIIRIHERIDDLNKTAQQTQLLLGEVYGQLKQLNARKDHG